MKTTDINYFLDMAKFLRDFRSRILRHKDTYGLIGACGDSLFIEIAKGHLKSRETVAILNVEVAREFILDDFSHFAVSDELYIALPSQAHFVGLVNLLSRILDIHLSYLHPLDDKGDCYHDWDLTVDL